MELKKDTPPQKKRRFRSWKAGPDAGWGYPIQTFLSDSWALWWFSSRNSMLRIGRILLLNKKVDCMVLWTQKWTF